MISSCASSNIDEGVGRFEDFLVAVVAALRVMETASPHLRANCYFNSALARVGDFVVTAMKIIAACDDPEQRKTCAALLLVHVATLDANYTAAKTLFTWCGSIAIGTPGTGSRYQCNPGCAKITTIPTLWVHCARRCGIQPAAQLTVSTEDALLLPTQVGSSCAPWLEEEPRSPPDNCAMETEEGIEEETDAQVAVSTTEGVSNTAIAVDCAEERTMLQLESHLPELTLPLQPLALRL
ncbi:hypothetical protein FI667_g14654, partial [Globisporangium splendens]